MPRLVGLRAGRRAASAIARELGLPRNTIVGAGGGDAALGAIGLGAIRAGEAFISLGTACQLILASDVYRAAPELLVHSFAHALPNRWYRMAAMLNGAGTLAFAARLTGADVAELETRGGAATIAVRASCCSCLICRANARRSTIRARAASPSASPATTRAISRAR